MHSYTAVVEKDNDTGLYVGFVPGFHGAHCQADACPESEFVGNQAIQVD
jgi:predicted RNase H-like HicB family nuclease